MALVWEGGVSFQVNMRSLPYLVASYERDKVVYLSHDGGCWVGGWDGLMAGLVAVGLECTVFISSIIIFLSAYLKGSTTGLPLSHGYSCPYVEVPYSFEEVMVAVNSSLDFFDFFDLSRRAPGGRTPPSPPSKPSL